MQAHISKSTVKEETRLLVSLKCFEDDMTIRYSPIQHCSNQAMFKAIKMHQPKTLASIIVCSSKFFIATQFSGRILHIREDE